MKVVFDERGDLGEKQYDLAISDVLLRPIAIGSPG
jgi:hypothetical protein